MFENISPPPPDSLMEIARLFRSDARDQKIDLGIGTYRNEEGRVDVMAAVKEAEQRHCVVQTGKAYLGPGGDQRFCSLLEAELFPGLPATADRRLTLIQTPGGTGAYRLGLELAAYQSPETVLIIGTPTWPNHIPVADRVGLRCSTYPYYDPKSGSIDLDAMLRAVSDARAGDLILLHGCCHNPTGARLDDSQWRELIAAIHQARILPLIDLAYAGMARGIEADVGRTRSLLETLPEAIVAISCSKSFGLYSERTGMLAVLGSSPAAAQGCRITAEALARSLWSNPPDHGAAIVRTILDDALLRARWREELDTMRRRLTDMRVRLAGSAEVGIDRLIAEEGLFAVLPVTPNQILALREQHAIYMDLSGRINIAGLNRQNIDFFLGAYGSVTMGRNGS